MLTLRDMELDIPVAAGHRDLIGHAARALRFRLGADQVPVRFAITETGPGGYHCEVGVAEGLAAAGMDAPRSIFDLERRPGENADAFNAVFLVPTGVGCEIGGHAGDATPAARLLAAACDRLITHPNAVNAADLNEMPANAVYVEGSVLARMIMGTAGLAPVRANRVLVVIDEHELEISEGDTIFRHSAINAVNGARASAGFACEDVATLSPRMRMEAAYASSGRAAGRVTGFARLCEIVEAYRDRCDAVAITTVVDVDRDLHDDYFARPWELVNPWGGVEALLTHTLSLLYDLPAAHSPMYENREIMNEDPGVMEARVAAEGVSVAFLHCVLKGLHASPRVVSDPDAMRRAGVLTAEDVSCLVIPDGCVGLPTLGALEQGIPVVAVRENANKMRNDLAALPWRAGQLQVVENYWEAAGVMLALREGIAPAAARRPFGLAGVDERVERAAPVAPARGEGSG